MMMMPAAATNPYGGMPGDMSGGMGGMAGMTGTAGMPDMTAMAGMPDMTAMAGMAAMGGMAGMGGMMMPTFDPSMMQQQKAFEFIQTFASQPDPTGAAIEYLNAMYGQGGRQAKRMRQDNYADQSSVMMQMPMGPGPVVFQQSTGGSPRGGAPVVGDNGNWKCKSCGNINFGHRDKCNRCDEKRPDDIPAAMPTMPANPYGGMTGGGMMGGYDYSQGMSSQPKRKGPPVEGEDGNWKCSQCGNINYGHRDKCNRCDANKP